MKTLELDKATAPLARYARGVKKHPIVVTVQGKPIAALLAVENADLETVSLSTNPCFVALIERSRVRQKFEGGISSEAMRRRLGLKSKSRGG